MKGAQLAHVFRHPIKGLGSEALDQASLSPDGALEGDRAWAVLNADAPDTDEWQPRRNFLQVASGPDLARLRARTVEGGIQLSHPDQADLVVRPETDGDALARWARPLWPAARPAPARLVRALGHGMTDMKEPYVSLGNLSSLRALSELAGMMLDPRRFRINLWVEGLAPWKEFDLIDRAFSIGDVPLRGAERIGRCRAPEANPDTGRRDVTVIRLLEDAWNHTDFGIYLTVEAAGTVKARDQVTLPWS